MQAHLIMQHTGGCCLKNLLLNRAPAHIKDAEQKHDTASAIATCEPNACSTARVGNRYWHKWL